MHLFEILCQTEWHCGLLSRLADYYLYILASLKCMRFKWPRLKQYITPAKFTAQNWDGTISGVRGKNTTCLWMKLYNIPMTNCFADKNCNGPVIWVLNLIFLFNRSSLVTTFCGANYLAIPRFVSLIISWQL